MASVHEYKRFENTLIQKIKDGVTIAAGGFYNFLCGFVRVFIRPYTIVLVPHSEKKVYNLRITLLSIVLFFLVFTGIIGAVFHYGSTGDQSRISLADSDSRLINTQASLDLIKDEVTLLLREWRNFEPIWGDVIRRDNDRFSGSSAVSSGDLSSIFGNSGSDGVFQEVENLRRIREQLNFAAIAFDEFSTHWEARSAFLTEIPSIWPIRGGLGTITMFFGQNPNPFTGQTYIHMGIDISNNRQGDPIVATADGQVVSVEFEQGGMGNNVIIRHKHGFYTRYAHMLNFRVTRGQIVRQGDIIGYVGNTGLSTGPHLHYEIHVGSDVVDPYRYLNVRSNIARTAR